MRERPDERSLWRAEKAILDAHLDVLLGPLAAFHEDEEGEDRFEWRLGFIRSARIPPRYRLGEPRLDLGAPRLEPIEMLRILLCHPSSRLLRDLVIELCPTFGTSDEHAGIARFLGEHPCRSLRFLHFGECPDREPWWRTELGDISPLWNGLPSVERLVLQGELWRLGDLKLPVLRELDLRAPLFENEVAFDLARASMPSLERLVLWAANSTLEDLEPLLTDDLFPTVRHFGLQHAPYADELCARLPDTWLSGVESLDLSNGALSDEGAELLLQAAPRLSRLRRLDLRRTRISPEMAARVSSVLPVISG